MLPLDFKVISSFEKEMDLPNAEVVSYMEETTLLGVNSADPLPNLSPPPILPTLICGYSKSDSCVVRLIFLL